MRRKTNRKKKNKFIEIIKHILNVSILITEQQIFQDIIKWDDSGMKILILDKELLQTTVLPSFFNHSNYSSFQRQLNTYGFQSCREINNCISYSNPAFTRDKVRKIKKKIYKKSVPTTPFSIIEDEYEALRKQMSLLKQEQDKISEKVRESIQYQMKIQTAVQKMLLVLNHQSQTRMTIAYTGITCTQRFTKNIKILVSSMLPEIQQAYSVLFKVLFPSVQQSSSEPQLINFSPLLQNQEDLNLTFCSFGFQL